MKKIYKYIDKYILYCSFYILSYLLLHADIKLLGFYLLKYYLHEAFMMNFLVLMQWSLLLSATRNGRLNTTRMIRTILNVN